MSDRMLVDFNAENAEIIKVKIVKNSGVKQCMIS